MKSRQLIDDFLSQRALAVVGVSRSGKGFGNVAARELRRKGYCVYPVNADADVVDGERCFRSLADLPEPVGGVLVVVPPDRGIEVVRQAAAAGIRRVWLQQGAESPRLELLCAELGLQTITGECILMFATPSGIHQAHRWLWSMLGKIPA